jgi:hypothetical protein
MKRQLQIVAISRTSPQIKIAEAYFQLQRLRQLVEEAERSLASPAGSAVPPPAVTIRPDDQHRLSN